MFGPRGLLNWPSGFSQVVYITPSSCLVTYLSKSEAPTGQNLGQNPQLHTSTYLPAPPELLEKGNLRLDFELPALIPDMLLD